MDAGIPGAYLGGGIAMIYALICYFTADSLLLSTLKAKRIVQEQNTHLYTKVHALAKAAHIVTPQLYYIDDSAMNILSLGKNESQGKIIITKGLMEKLTSAEIEAVIAHELIHIQRNDTQTQEYAALIVAIFPFMAEKLRRTNVLLLPLAFLFSLLSPLSAFFMQIVLSPKREFEADASGMLLTRHPQALADALQKITHDPYSVHAAMQATAHLFIVNPFHGKANRSASILFTTHPPVQERIKILQEM